MKAIRRRRGRSTPARFGSAVAVLFVVVGLWSCATSGGDTAARRADGREPVPGWYEDPNSVYPEEEYLTAIGSGDTRRAAEQDALGAMSQIFEARVSVDNRVNERYREIAGGSEEFSEREVELANMVNVRSEQDLMNVQYGESFTDSDGRVHVIGYMNRLETGRIYRDLIEKNASQVDRFVSRAQDETAIMRRFAFAGAAEIVAQNNRALVDQLRIISPPLAATTNLPYDEQRVTELRSEIASEMGYRVEVTGDAAGRVKDTVSEALSEAGFVVSDEGPLRVIGSAELEEAEGGRYEEARWYLNLRFVGPEGDTVVSYNAQDRASGISMEAARAFAFSDMEETARDEFVGRITQYFDGLVIQ
ncbi:MAG: LPP20 family lipoprotein [Spirochaetaceae bacterium]